MNSEKTIFNFKAVSNRNRIGSSLVQWHKSLLKRKKNQNKKNNNNNLLSVISFSFSLRRFIGMLITEFGKEIISLSKAILFKRFFFFSFIWVIIQEVFRIENDQFDFYLKSRWLKRGEIFDYDDDIPLSELQNIIFQIFGPTAFRKTFELMT